MASGAQYPWYEAVDGPGLAQGDLLSDFQVLVARALAAADALETLAEYHTFDLVVMTQTCDIEQGKAESLLLCPRWDLWTFVEAAKRKGQNWGREIRESLRQGNLPGYHLLNEGNEGGISIGLSVVDFHEVYSSPADVVRDFAQRAGKRLRLLPPYREHLAQAFARFFMRVGLPVDIAREKLRRAPDAS